MKVCGIRYRSIILALVGWLALAASPPNKDGRNPKKSTTPKIERAAQSVGVEQEVEIPDLYQPCGQGPDDRTSDLCAQWTAADAAKSAADATWLFGMLGSLIGVFTLAAAWSAAKWAKKAAEHTAECVVEANHWCILDEKRRKQTS